MAEKENIYRWLTSGRDNGIRIPLWGTLYVGSLVSSILTGCLPDRSWSDHSRRSPSPRFQALAVRQPENFASKLIRTESHSAWRWGECFVLVSKAQYKKDGPSSLRSVIWANGIVWLTLFYMFCTLYMCSSCPKIWTRYSLKNSASVHFSVTPVLGAQVGLAMHASQVLMAALAPRSSSIFWWRLYIYSEHCISGFIQQLVWILAAQSPRNLLWLLNFDNIASVTNRVLAPAPTFNLEALFRQGRTQETKPLIVTTNHRHRKELLHRTKDVHTCSLLFEVHDCNIGNNVAFFPPHSQCQTTVTCR